MGRPRPLVVALLPPTDGLRTAADAVLTQFVNGLHRSGTDGSGGG